MWARASEDEHSFGFRFAVILSPFLSCHLLPAHYISPLKKLCSLVFSYLLLPRPAAFLLNGGKCNGVEADFKGIDLSPESRKAEGSLEEQKDEFQRDPKGVFLSAGIPAELVFHHGVQLGSVCVSGDGDAS